MNLYLQFYFSFKESRIEGMLVGDIFKKISVKGVYYLAVWQQWLYYSKEAKWNKMDANGQKIKHLLKI